MNIDIVKFCEDNLGNKREVTVNLSEADFEHVRLAQNRLAALQYGVLIHPLPGSDFAVTLQRSPGAFPEFYKQAKTVSPTPPVKQAGVKKPDITPEEMRLYTAARDELVATINAAIAKFHNETPFDIWAISTKENEKGTVTSVHACFRSKK